MTQPKKFNATSVQALENLVRDVKLDGLMPSKIKRDSRWSAIFGGIAAPTFRLLSWQDPKKYRTGSVRRKVSYSLFCLKFFTKFFRKREKIWTNNYFEITIH